MSNAYVYQHITKDTKEIFYIGISNANNLKRAYTNYKRSIFWKNIVDKHGYNVEIIYKNLTWEEACNIEINLIKQYGRRDLGLGTLVNLTDGGDGTINIIRKPVSEITKKRLSIINKGKKLSEETKLKISLIQIGKKLSQETKTKMSNSRRGVPRSALAILNITNNSSNSKKVIDIKTNIIYRSITEASRLLNIPYCKLKSDLKGRTKNKTTLKYLNYE